VSVLMSVDWVRGFQVILSCGLGRLPRLSVVRWSLLIRAYVRRYRVLSLRICSFVYNVCLRCATYPFFGNRGDCCASLTLTQTLTLTIATLVELVICKWDSLCYRKLWAFGHREWWGQIRRLWTPRVVGLRKGIAFAAPPIAIRGDHP
jgi:hypothetical protein